MLSIGVIHTCNYAVKGRRTHLLRSWWWFNKNKIFCTSPVASDSHVSPPNATRYRLIDLARSYMQNVPWHGYM